MTPAGYSRMTEKFFAGTAVTSGCPGDEFTQEPDASRGRNPKE